MARLAGRHRNQLPTCYYEGYLEKRSFKDKTSRKMWTCLCGNMLYFYNEKREAAYIEKLDLTGFISVIDDSSQDRNLDAARFILKAKDGNTKFTAPSAEARELWKGFILSVSELSVPPFLNLLPGQLHMMKEAVEEERERLKNIPPPVLTANTSIRLKTDLPPCYHRVSRLEAELLLEKESKRGNLLLRPGSDGNSFSISTRQDHIGAKFSHYRVTHKHEGGYAIEMGNPIPCATLHDVINYFIEKTEGVLIPLSCEEQYEKNIFFVQADHENGERSFQQALPNLFPPLPPKPVAIKVPTPERTPVPVMEKRNELGKYEREAEEEPVVTPPEGKEWSIPRVPIPAPRKCKPSSTPCLASSTNRDVTIRKHSDPLGQAISELKLKFEQKAKSQE